MYDLIIENKNDNIAENLELITNKIIQTISFGINKIKNE